MFARPCLPATLVGGAAALTLGACTATAPTVAAITPVTTEAPAPLPEDASLAETPGGGAPAERTLPGEAVPEDAVSDDAVVEIPRAVEAPPGVSAAAEAALAREEQERRNAEIVIEFYEMVFRDHLVEEAIARFGDDIYIQHNPGAPNGWEALKAYLVPYFRANPLARSEIQRVIAQDDLVVLHVLAKTDPVDRGRALVDIFRVEDGKIVEHWDVVQPIPPAAVNENTMF